MPRLLRRRRRLPHHEMRCWILHTSLDTRTAHVKNQCTSVSRLQQNTAPAPAETQEPELIECNADADCVSTGCSGQLCLPRGKVQAKPMFTTCDYRDEYGCLKETSCGCQEGRC